MKPIPSSPFPSPSPGGEAPLDHRVGLRVSQLTPALVQEKSILATSFEQACSDSGHALQPGSSTWQVCTTAWFACFGRGLGSSLPDMRECFNSQVQCQDRCAVAVLCSPVGREQEGKWRGGEKGVEGCPCFCFKIVTGKSRLML